MQPLRLVLLGVPLIFAAMAFAEASVHDGKSLTVVSRADASVNGNVRDMTSANTGVSRCIQAGLGTQSLGCFAYAEILERPGTRSAGVRGLLTYDGFRLNGFDGRRLRTPIGSYYYVESQQLWNDQGWFPMADIPITVSDAEFDSIAQDAGHYTGGFRDGTPESWCYDPGSDTWYAPDLLLLKLHRAN